MDVFSFTFPFPDEIKYLVTRLNDASRGRIDKIGDGFNDAEVWPIPTGDAGGTDGCIAEIFVAL